MPNEPGIAARNDPPRTQKAVRRKPDDPLRLRRGYTREMTRDEEGELVSALAELLVEWYQKYPDKAPPAMRRLLRSPREA
jgi:hypothetical protein